MSQTKEKTVKIGKITLPMGTKKSAFVPTNGKEFVDHGDILTTIALGVRDNLAVLLIGESGTGKTSAIRYTAHKTGNGLRRVNLNGGTTADELVGRKMFNDKGTYWVDGILTEAMRAGDWVVLDEINAALPEVLFVLQSVLDDDGFLVLTEKDDKEIVHKHPNFRLFATCNPPEYAGTKEMNQSLLSRFAICMSADFAPEAIEKTIIENHLGNAIANSVLATTMLVLAKDTRESKSNGKTNYAINTRDILNVLRLAETLNPLEAFALAFANKLEGADSKAMKTLAKLQLPSTKVKANLVRKDVTDVKEIAIGSHYITNSDMGETYLLLTEDKEEASFGEIVKTSSLPEIMNNNPTKEPAIKGDEFTVHGTYYTDLKEVSKVEETNAGAKMGSVIQITGGPNKDKWAIIIHSQDLDNACNTHTADIIKHIHEIS